MNATDPNIDTSYFDAISDVFIARRGKGLILNSHDWQLMEDWQDSGIPLHVVCGTINQVFDQQRSGQRTATINSLRYCSPAVDAAFQQWQKSRVGANEVAQTSVCDSPPSNPFSKESVLAHLEKCQTSLLHAAESIPPALMEGLQEPFLAVTVLASAVIVEWVGPKYVEERLTEIEAQIDTAIKAAATPAQLTEAGRAVTAQLAEHRSRMPDKFYQQQFNNLLMKRLRESYGIPRLSLFFGK